MGKITSFEPDSESVVEGVRKGKGGRRKEREGGMDRWVYR